MIILETALKSLTYIKRLTQKELSQRKLEIMDSYSQKIQWGRQHPVEFGSRFLGFEYIDFQRYLIYNTWFADYALWVMCRGGSKALALNTPIPTPDGYREMKDIQTGDYVYDERGFPTKVINTSEVKFGEPCYEICFDDGEKIVASGDHLWQVQPVELRTWSNKKKNPQKIYKGHKIDNFGFITLKTDEMKDSYIYSHTNFKGYRYKVPKARALRMPKVHFDIEPYVLGLWLGKGYSGRNTVAWQKDDIEEVQEYVREYGYFIKPQKSNRFSIHTKGKGQNTFRRALIKYGIFENKKVPDEYLKGNVSQRYDLLKGIMDADGLNNRGQCYLNQTSLEFAESIGRLLNSLCIQYSINKHITRKDDREYEYYRIYFLSDQKKPCFRLKRKFDLLPKKRSFSSKHKTIISITRVPTVAVKCIAVDSPRQLYLCGNYNTVTHNTTTMAMYDMLRTFLLPYHNTYILGNTGSQAKEVFMKIEKIAKKEIPEMVSLTDIFMSEIQKSGPTGDGFVRDPSSYRFTLFNASSVFTLNSDVVNIKGKRANLVNFDEAGWMSDELFIQAENFATQNSDFKLALNEDISIMPLNFSRQLLYASSASDTGSGFYKKYKQFSQRMIMGDRRYFTCNLTVDVVLNAKVRGEKYPPLIQPSKVEQQMIDNPEKGERELYNVFSADNYKDQIISMRDIIKHTENIPPALLNKDGKKTYILAWDSARINDNSVIGIAEIYNDPKTGWNLKIVNLVSLVDVRSRQKTPMIVPDQVEKFKEILLAYNGNNFGKLDYENIMAVICDSGAAGQMIGGVTDYLLKGWTDKEGVEHKGLIDRSHKAYETVRFSYPDAVDIVKLVNPRGNRNEIFEAAEKMTKLGVVHFPAEFDGKDELTLFNNDGSEETYEIYELSNEEKIALAQITKMKDEIVSMCKYTSGGNISYDFAPEKRNRMHDDRVFTYGLLCWYLAILRRGQTIKKEINVNNMGATRLLERGFRMPKYKI